jgi:hypothetical protein
MDGLPTLERLMQVAAETPEPVTVAPELRRALGVLSLALGHALSEEQLLVYAYVLQDVDLRHLRQACVLIARTAQWWPKPAELIAQVEALARDEAITRRMKLEALLPAAEEADPRTWVRCQNCADEGWVMHTCAGGASRTCGRPSKGHFVTDPATKHSSYVGACRSSHLFAVRCMCAYLHREV